MSVLTTLAFIVSAQLYPTCRCTISGALAVITVELNMILNDKERKICIASF